MKDMQSLNPWISYKIREFQTLGYTSITMKDIQRYLTDYLWKKGIPENLFECIYQLNQMTANDYFDFESIMAQTKVVESLEDLDLSELI